MSSRGCWIRSASALDLENREAQTRLREQHAEKAQKPLLSLEAARSHRPRLRYDELPAPPFIGTRETAVEVAASCRTSTGSSSSMPGT